MISQGLSPPYCAGSRNPARFWGAVELFHSCQLDGGGVCTSGRPQLCFPLTCKQYTHCGLAPESWVIPATASGLNTGLPFALFCQWKVWNEYRRYSRVNPLPMKNRWCSLSSGLSFSECEIPRGAGGSLGAAGSCEALHRAKWCFCPNHSRSIKALTSAVSQPNSLRQGTLVSLSPWKQE